MRKIKIILAAGAAMGAAFGGGIAAAQTLVDAKVAVVDTERVMRDCTACVAANQQLQAQLTALQQFAQQQGQPLQSEQQTLDAALKAANGKPDNALQQRVQAFQIKAQTAQRQVSEREAVFQRNVQFVEQQVTQRMGPVVQQVAQQRGATIALGKHTVLFASNTLDITDAVLTALNQQLPSVSTTAPPPAQPAAQQPAPQQPQPQGR